MKPERDSQKLSEILAEDKFLKRRSKTARLEEMFDEVMELKSKFPHKVIVEALQEKGLIFTTPGTFEMTLGRIAKKRIKNGLKAKEEETPQFAKPAPQSSTVRSSSASAELMRPPGISNAAWNEMRAKDAAEKRKKF